MLSVPPVGEYLLQNAKLVIAVQIMMIFLGNIFENDVLGSFKRPHHCNILPKPLTVFFASAFSSA